MIYICVSKNSVSNLPIKIQTYVGAHIVPIAAQDISCLIWLLNSKKNVSKQTLRFVQYLCRNFFLFSPDYKEYKFCNVKHQ